MDSAKTKKLINGVQTCVDDNIEGLLAVNPGLRKVKGHRVIVRSDLEQYVASKKVAILTGGGSGHEPAFAGYVGPGMATGAVQGDIFASPSSSEVLAGIRAVGRDNPAGVLVLYNNYTGDRLNFGIAVEKARASGVRVTMVTNADDCALVTADKTAGRRGLAGLILMIKVAGALAEEGKSLETVTEMTESVGSSIGTLGICLTPCSVPGMGKLFNIDPDSMEIGLGLHGEAGVQTVKMMSAHDTVNTMIDHMTNPSNKIHISVKKDDDVALLVNNLGAMSDLETNIIALEAIQYLERKGVQVSRCYANRFVTSQEMSGCSITIMLLDAVLKQCLDAKGRALAWVEPMMAKGTKDRRPVPDLQLPEVTETLWDSASTYAQIDSKSEWLLKQAVVRVSQTLEEATDHLNQLDAGCGDGDCGSTLSAGAKAIREKIEALSFQSPTQLLLQVAALAETAMGGSSGALYGLFFTAAAPLLFTDTTRASWLAAFKAGIHAIQTYGGAEPGDRTMLDSLAAAYSALEQTEPSMTLALTLKDVAKAAEEGAEATTKMRAQAGRASYVSATKWNAPDPGAWAVALCFGAIRDVVTAVGNT